MAQGHFVIRSKGDPRFTVRLAYCTQDHAQSVFTSIDQPGFTGPRDLEMERLADLPPRGQPVPVEPVLEPVSVSRWKFWRR